MLVQHGLTLLLGAALGWVYFQMLWTTVHRLPQLRRPAMWMVVSLFARLALAMAVLVLLVRWGGWSALMVAVIGFTITRTVFVRRMRDSALKTEDLP